MSSSVVRCLAAGIVLALTGPRPALGQDVAYQHTEDHREFGEYVGAYEVTTDHVVVITFSPTHDHLWVTDFDDCIFSLAKKRQEIDVFSTTTEEATGLVFARDDAGTIAGLTWTIAGKSVSARRLDTLRIEEVTWTNDDVQLTGTVMIPTGSSPVPGAVIAQGAGAASRDNLWSQSIAQMLARSGVAVLLPDKRGSGTSGGQWERSSFEDLAADMLTARQVLEQIEGVDKDRVGVVGLSQGGWVVPIAAYLNRDIPFVIDVAGAVVAPSEQVAHEITQDMRGMGLTDEQIAELLHLQRLKVAAYDSITAWHRYRDERQRLVDAGYTQINEGSFFPTAPGGRHWTFWQLIHDFDPMPLWRDIAAPTLIVFGREDEHDNVPVARCEELLDQMLAENPDRDLTLRIFEGAGHSLFDTERRWGYLRDDFRELVLSWIEEKTGD